MSAALAAPPPSALAALAAPDASMPVQPTVPITHDANTQLMANEQRGGPDMQQAALLKRWAETINIAEELDETTVAEIGMKVQREYEMDEGSRSEWLDKYKKWMEKALQVTQPKTYPWVGASNVIYPLMSTASVQFAARAYPAIVQNRNVVKGVIVGDDTDDMKKQRSERIGGYMSWQLLDEMPEWEPDTDKLLHILPIVGCCFRKSYFDPSVQRNVSRLVTADKVCVNYHAISFERAPRITEILMLYPVEVEEMVRSGVFLDQDYRRMSSTDQADEDAPIGFLEQHRRIDLDGDGYAEPYIVTILKDTATVARIAAAYDMEGIIYARTASGEDKIRTIKAVEYFTKYDFIPNPDGGIYGVGFGHLLYPINEAINTTLNQLLDAGHLANTGGGFIGKGVSLSAGSMRFAPGEFKQVNAPGQALKDNIVPLPFPGPNVVLFQLLGFLVEAGKEVAAIKDILMGEQPAGNVPATTVLALIEQGMQVFSAIYKRVHRSLKAEYAKLYRLNRLYLDQEAKFRIGDQWKTVMRSDFAEGAGVEPISDPTMVSDMQKLGRANFLMQFSGAPFTNVIPLMKRVYEYAGIDKPDEILNEKPTPDPMVQLQAQQLQQNRDIAQQDLALRQAREVEEARRIRERDKVSNQKDMSTAYLNYANAIKAAGDNERGFIETEMKRIQAYVTVLGASESAGGDSSGGSFGADESAGGNNASAVPAMAAPPGFANGPAVSGPLAAPPPASPPG